MGRERKEIKGMRNRVGGPEHECGGAGRGRAGQLRVSPGTALFTHRGGPAV